jgi:hypothetical protein
MLFSLFTSGSKSFELTEEVWDEYSPIVEDFIAQIEADQTPPDQWKEEKRLDLTNTKVNPYTLWQMLLRMGYQKTRFSQNGWEFDFWLDFEKPGCKTLLVWGTGITFNLWLQEKTY